MNKFHKLKTGFAVFALLASCGLSAMNAGATLSADTQARLIGGFAPLNPSDPEVQQILRDPSWRDAAQHSSFAANWRMERIHGNQNLFTPASHARISSYLDQNLGPSHLGARHILYFFGGADALFPALAFPNFDRLVLVGLENPGRLLNPEALRIQGTLGRKMSEVGRAFADVLTLSYFITSNMAKELQEFGVSTMVSVGLVADGYRVLGADEISLDKQGQLQLGALGRVHGVRISFEKPNGQRGEVLYFRQDLSDAGLAGRPEFSRFVQDGDFDTAYYKAASYVSHNRAFGQVSKLVLSKVKTVVQSDDGIPFRMFMENSPAWSMRLFGFYTQPDRKYFSYTNTQTDLTKAYDDVLCKAGAPADLALWTRIWPGACRQQSAGFGFSSISWNGSLPFRYGYAAVSGPDQILNWAQKIKFGNLIVAEKR